jgi:hypothetical protein
VSLEFMLVLGLTFVNQIIVGGLGGGGGGEAGDVRESPRRQRRGVESQPRRSLC